MYARIENDQVVEYPIMNIHQRLPNVSLPAELTEDSQLPDGFVFVRSGSIPGYNPATHKPVQGALPVKESAGWVTSFSIEALTEDEIAARSYVESPSVVSMRQARLALLQFGLLDTVNAAVAAGGDADKITWEYATEVDRNSPMVSNLAGALSLTDQDLNNLFILAGSL